MSWKLELVETGPASGARRMEVAWLGEIVAPASVDGIGLDHGMAQRLLGDIQQAVVALQEAALQAEADRCRRLDPTLRLKDYRLRRIQGLHGTLAIRVPRLVRLGTGTPAAPLLCGSARSTAEYREVLAHLGAWMSFRAAAGLVEELFPLASGGSMSTVRRRVFAGAARIEAEGLSDRVEPATTARSIDLGMDTTFVRSCAPDGPRHHEVLIGVATADDGRIRRFGGVIAALDPPHGLITDALGPLGRAPDTTITAFTDGDEMRRGYLLKAGIRERPVLDWPHLARRVQVAKTTARGLRTHTNREYRALPAIRRLLDSPHWRLWHGQTARGRQALSSIERRLEAFDARCRRPDRTAVQARRLHTAMTNLREYVDGHSAYLVDYEQRQRAGQPVGTSTSEGLANALVNRRMNKLQQMRWSAAGAHAVVTVRVDAMNAPRRGGAVATASAA
ncbi:MAG: hypothetical protein RLO06_09085 [Parvibaculum sp.]